MTHGSHVAPGVAIARRLARAHAAVGGPVVRDPDRRLAALRVLIGAYVTVWSSVRAPHLLDTIELEARRFDPVGSLAWIPQPLPSWVIGVAVLATPALGVAVTLGWRHRVTAPLLAVTFLTVTTYRNSWGQIFHTEHLVALHVAVLAVAPADRHWAVGSRPSSARDHPGDWAVRSMAVMTVCTYFVAGVAKLRISGWAWVDGDVLLHQVSFDNARKDLLGDTSSPFASFLVQQQWVTAPAAWASMIVELGAPLALAGRRLATLWSGAAWAFHVAILVFMAILFPYHLLGLALAPLLPVERAVDAALAAGRRRSGRGEREGIPSTPMPARGSS